MAESVRETSKVTNPEGLYRHPETGKEVVVKTHPKFGTAQADGVKRVGFVHVGPAPKKEEQEEKAEEKRVEMPTEAASPNQPKVKKGGK